MPDLLLELFSEEIPARMQKQAAEDLKKLVTNALVDRGLVYEGASAFATPRRLALNIVGLPARQPDTREEKKGPRVGSPEQAVQGFLKSAGLTDIAQAKIESDPKKGEFYVAIIEKSGRATLDVLAEILPEIIRSFPWPKSMRWGAASVSSSSLRWVRPLRGIVATFGGDTEEPEIVPFDVDGLHAGNITWGHRFMAPGEIRVKRFDDYVTKLEAAKVVLSADRRKEIIRADAATLAFAGGLEVIEDEGLLDEVSGLVEWPVVLMGSFEEAFLDVPGEVIRATIRANQKCFVLKKADGTPEAKAMGGELANRFLLTANIEAKDGGKTIIAGNERVIRARLSDAKFFWDTDRKVWKDDPEFKRLEKFQKVTFHEKLGSQWDRIKRIESLAKELCEVTGADEALVDRAARLCKADLLTEVVGEFPEVQGLMGRKYAELNGEHASVAAACEEHYKPVGPNDSVPTDKVSVTLALADKLDTLVGFWAIDEKPTGSKDPYALRRAALGVIRLVVENEIKLSAVLTVFGAAMLPICWGFRPSGALGFKSLYPSCDLENGDSDQISWRDARFARLLGSDGFIKKYADSIVMRELGDPDMDGPDFSDTEQLELTNRHEGTQEINRRLEYLRSFEVSVFFDDFSGNELFPRVVQLGLDDTFTKEYGMAIASDLLSFFHDRLKVMLRDSGARHDLVDAVLANGEANDDLLLVVNRVKALGTFLETEDGKSLLAGFKRAANILRAEEKKAENGKTFEGAFEAAANPAVLVEASEKALYAALSDVENSAAAALEKQDFEGAMRAMAKLRAPVDAFFEAVMVNADDPALRLNRLSLLANLRRVTAGVADFSKISG